MSRLEYSPKILLLLALISGVINLLPNIFIVTNGDILMNKAQILCFGEQIWSGHLYPRWCMEPNGGLGSPLPIFYLPLPFYVSAIFYPLRHIGLSIDTLYLLCLLLANVVTFITCTLWLKDLLKPQIAYLAAFFLLWTPYRMELIGVRASFAELWGMAFLPLIFLYTRQFIISGSAAWPKLSLAIALALLAHAPATLIGLMGAGIQLLFFSYRDYKKFFVFAGCVILGFLVTFFHWVAPTYFVADLDDAYGGVSNWRAVWINSYASQLMHTGHYTSLLALAFAVMLAAFLSAQFFRRSHCITQPAVRIESLAWIASIVWALLLMFPIAEPLWILIERISQVKTPWRMNLLLTFGYVYLGSMALQWFYNRPGSIRSGDLAVLFSFWLFLGMVMMQGIAGTPEAIHKLERTLYIPGYALPKWAAAKDTLPPENFFARYNLDQEKPHAAWVSGKGSMEIKQWNYDGIVIDVDTAKAGRLRLEHFYFPVWHASLDGKLAAIATEMNDGRMLLDVPAGKHEIRLWIDIVAAMPPVRRYLWIVSLLAVAVIGYGITKKRAIVSAA